MPGIGNTYRDTILSRAAQLAATPAFPTNLYLALCSSTPLVTHTSATIPELTSAGGYARQLCALGAPSGGSSSNTGTISFPQSTAAWSAVATNWALCDVSGILGAGTLCYFGPLQGTNDVQTVSTSAQLTAGSYTLNPTGVTTVAIPYNATAAQILEYLEAAGGIGNFTVAFSGNRFDQATPGTLVITFIGAQASTAETLMTLTPTGITGGTLSIAHTTTGVSGAITVPGALYTVQFAPGQIATSLS